MWYVNGLCRDVPFEITDSADSCRVGYRTGIAVTPENDDLWSDLRLTRPPRSRTERYVVVFDRILSQRRSGVSGRPANAQPF